MTGPFSLSSAAHCLGSLFSGLCLFTFPLYRGFLIIGMTLYVPQKTVLSHFEFQRFKRFVNLVVLYLDFQNLSLTPIPGQC